MLHLFNFSPLCVFKCVLKFMGGYKVALAAFDWLFCLLKCILKLSRLSKLDVTGYDFSPLCVSNFSSNVDEEICIQSGGFCASICWPSTQLGQVCQFVTMLMNDVMVTLLHLSLTSNNICLNSPVNVMVTMIHLLSTANNICLNSPMQATNPSTPIKHFNTMLPAGKYEKRGTYFHTGQIACRGLHYKLMAILTNLTKLGKSWNFIGWKVLHPLPHSK